MVSSRYKQSHFVKPSLVWLNCFFSVGTYAKKQSGHIDYVKPLFSSGHKYNYL